MIRKARPAMRRSSRGCRNWAKWQTHDVISGIVKGINPQIDDRNVRAEAVLRRLRRRAACAPKTYCHRDVVARQERRTAVKLALSPRGNQCIFSDPQSPE